MKCRSYFRDVQGDYSNMRILVTGGLGFIGSFLVDALVDAGHIVTVIDDGSHGKDNFLNPQARLYKLDICSELLSSVFKENKPEIVFHHAARTSVNHSMQDPLDDARVNILGSINLLQNCVKSAVNQVVYASTGGAIYGNPQYLPCDEAHPINPVSPYGSSKHAVEHYLSLFRTNWGLNYTILRYPNVYGPRQDSSGEAGVIAIFANRMLKKEKVYINGNGLQERDFVYVRDIVRANLKVIGHGDGKIYNLGSGFSISIKEIFFRMQKLAHYNIDPIFKPALSGEVFKIILNTERIKRELGWMAETNIDDGLTETIEYHRNQG